MRERLQPGVLPEDPPGLRPGAVEDDENPRRRVAGAEDRGVVAGVEQADAGEVGRSGECLGAGDVPDRVAGGEAEAYDAGGADLRGLDGSAGGVGEMA